MRNPIAYSPGLEQIDPDEAEAVEGLEEALLKIMKTTSEDYGHAVRAVHAKSHGLIEAELDVLPGLAPELAQGMFRAQGRYPAILRISTNPGDILRDDISLPRGLALKVLKVAGDRLEGAGDGDTQDFVMVNGLAFLARTPAQFLRSLKLLAKTTDRAEWAKSALSRVMRGVETAIEAVGGESGTVKSLGGAPDVHPLGETYFRQTAFRYDRFVAKFQISPVFDTLTRLTGTIIDASDDRDAIRHAVDAAMREGPAEWELRVQLCRDLEQMPIEDASVPWDEALSPFEPVARLRAKAQPAGDDARAAAMDDRLRFTVWNGLEAHRPLGAINRVRRRTYELSARFRETFNRCPIHEPASARLPEDAA